MDSLPRDPLSPGDAASAASQRTKARDSLFLMARLSVDGATVRDVRIRNLSEGGLMADVDEAVAAGTRVSLDIRGIGLVRGQVAWHAAGRIGIALDAPIDPKKARKPVGVGRASPAYAKLPLR